VHTLRHIVYLLTNLTAAKPQAEMGLGMGQARKDKQPETHQNLRPQKVTEISFSSKP
jgi:hypothetical protein